MSDPLARYHRQMILPHIGEVGQARLSSAHALLVGCGALGTVIADALVRAGVGRLTIVDRDVVELTNLQRQVLFDEADAREGVPKAEAAAARLRRINSQVEIVSRIADVTARNVEQLMGVADGGGHKVGVIVDGTDNFQTRYLLNDAAVKHGTPMVYGGAVGTAGMTMTIRPGVTACLRCVFPEAPPSGSVATCDTAGVLGPAVGVIAQMQAAEVIKVLSGHAEACSRTLREVDVWSGRLRALEIGGPTSECSSCALRRFEYLDVRHTDDTTSLCGADAVQVAPPGNGASIDLNALAARLANHGTFTVTRFLVRGVLSGEAGRGNGKAVELTVFRDGRAIIKGVQDSAAARTLYARYVGS